jgi:F-type H+-transporting ATPase subunit b
MKDVVSVTKTLFEMSRVSNCRNEILFRLFSISKQKKKTWIMTSLIDGHQDTAVTEHELHKMKQKMALKDEIKSILDGWVRVETQAREAEQAELVKQVVSSVQKQLEDPKLQKEIMSNSIAEIEGQSSPHLSYLPLFFSSLC